ncbi:MAG: Hsp70 family protein [Brumimicrobium sp.]
MGNINYGIDLGTTNSGIGVYDEGKVVVIKNPVGFRETIPSVVAFKKNRIIVGDKAQEALISSNQNVFTSFKRNMGTSETYDVPSFDETLTPVVLSSMVLSELRSFIGNIQLESVVITIPASFDTIQSNATKEAGYKAGFKEVVLLQEPIAACLTYANENDFDLSQACKWLVYDFGGGTFDVAIVSINDRELKVLDHKGNNFLGGIDIDSDFLEKIIVPRIQEVTGLSDLWNKINESEDPTYGRLGKYLIYQAEELKKELSLREEAWLEIDFEPLDIYEEISFKQEDLNNVVKKMYDESMGLLEGLIEDNNLNYQDFERIILVGGTTFIPFIRSSIASDTKIKVDFSVDPTTAVLKGAAYFAGGKLKTLNENSVVATKDEDESEPEKELDVVVSFESSSRDLEELIAFRTKDSFDGYFRITRKDLGFDSGMIKFNTSGNFFVNLRKGQTNHFELKIFDKDKVNIYSNDSIAITNGVYQVSGQPLPNDICIEVDGESETFMELIFKKNTILPLKKTIYKTFSKSIREGSEDKIYINILEGKIGTLPGANQSIGYIEMSGKDLGDDLIKGTDIEMTFSVSESRDLDLEIYIPGIDQVINKKFTPSFHNDIDARKVLSEIRMGKQKIYEKLSNAEDTENFELLAQLTRIKNSLEEVEETLNSKDGLANRKYRAIDQKRKLLMEIDQLDQDRSYHIAVTEYEELRDGLKARTDEMKPQVRQRFDEIMKDEKNFLTSGDKYAIKRKTELLDKISWDMFLFSDEYYFQLFYLFKTSPDSKFKNKRKVHKLLMEAEKAVENQKMNEIKALCNLISLEYIRDDSDSFGDDKNFFGTGLQ